MELIKKFISISVLVFLCFSNSFANQDEIKKMIKKNENYNLGLSKKDTTVQGVKLKPLTKIDAFNYSVKKNYGWTKYGVKVVNSSEGLPIRYGDTSLRFELHHEDCGFLYKSGKERDCIRSTAHHRFEIGTSKNKKSPTGYKHNQDLWYTVSFFLPQEHKFYRKQSVYQFHSSEGPYNPPFQLEIIPKKGLMVKILTSEGVYEETVGDCGGSIKEDIIYCEKAEIDYLVMTPDELENSLGKWSDLIIHAVWDKRPSEDEKNKGLFEVFINGEKKVHYTGQTMWDVGLSVVRIGIYQSKEPRTFKGKAATEQQMKDTPTIMFYDEIWVKKKCKDLKLDRLGYSCENLENQSDENTTPYSITKASQSEYIVVVKNKKDDTVLIKIIGDSKEKTEKEAMKKCKEKSDSSIKDSCYIHYSSMKSQY
tara:strand:+ start:48 stop:1313 length:1266 start_codon:yes stop_codon:yes gene_type:complete